MADGDLARSHVDGKLLRTRSGDLARVKTRTYWRCYLVLEFDISGIDFDQARYTRQDVIDEIAGLVHNEGLYPSGRLYSMLDATGLRWGMDWFMVTDGTAAPAFATAREITVLRLAGPADPDGVNRAGSGRNMVPPYQGVGTGNTVFDDGAVTSSGNPVVVAGYAWLARFTIFVPATATITYSALPHHPLCPH